MKKIITLTFLALATLVSTSVIAQPLIKKIVTDNSYMITQADSVKTIFEKDGFVLSKSTNMMMESNNELPVILSFTNDVTYRIVFISDNTSTSSEMKLMDFNDKVIATKKSNGINNVISYEYKASATQYHMIKPQQTNENKSKIDGHFMIFKK